MNAVKVAEDARNARSCVQHADVNLEHASRLAVGDPEMRRLTDAAIEAADAVLVRIGEVRHALAQRAMTAGYRR